MPPSTLNLSPRFRRTEASPSVMASRSRSMEDEGGRPPAGGGGKGVTVAVVAIG